MKAISLLLVFLLILQSCNVYNIPASVESAVDADSKAKVFTTDKQKLKFKRLEEENNRLIGVTKNGSSTAKKLAGMPAEIDGKYLKIDLSGIDIEEIKLRNKSTSTILTVVTVAGSVLVAYLSLFYIALSSMLENSIIIPM